jgi:hypothetical protein
MARMLTAETLLRGITLSSFGAHACQPSRVLGHEVRLGRREAAHHGNPDERW